jgi:hypothetical protein
MDILRTYWTLCLIAFKISKIIKNEQKTIGYICTTFIQMLMPHYQNPRIQTKVVAVCRFAAFFCRFCRFAVAAILKKKAATTLIQTSYIFRH